MADFSDSLDKDALKIEPYDALLNALDEYASTICIRKMYNINPSKDLLPVRKDLIGVIYRPLDLLKSLKSEISNIEKDGKLLFVVPDFNDRIENNFTESVKRMLVNAPVNVCIAVPKSFPYHFEKDIKFYTAARDKEKSGNIDENSKKTLKKILNL